MRSQAEYQGLVVVVPTRNRATLAMSSIRSLLSEPELEIQVLVSDNSTSQSEVSQLARFCQQLKDNRLQYVRPTEPLPMSEHWNWAMQRALQYEGSHFTVLTDRMMFKQGELDRLIEIVRQHPEAIISYKHDTIIDYRRPVKLRLLPWTGGVFEIHSARLLFLTAHAVLHDSLPRVLNCIVPRITLRAIRERFGAIFDSVAPDFNFCFKALELEDSFLFYDRAPLIQWALDRSNGQSAARGIVAGDYADFLATLSGKQLNYAAPIPEFKTVFNAILHEYGVIKDLTGSPKFVEIDMHSYLELIAKDVEGLEDANLKREMKQILAAHGWLAQPTGEKGQQVSAAKKRPASTLVKTRLKSILTGASTQHFWLSLEKHFAIRPPAANEFEFESSEDALAYALKFPRRPCASQAEEEKLLEYDRIGDM